MDVKMAVDKIFASIGDEINYSITLTNEKEIPLKEVWLVDELPLGLTFIEGSIEIDGYSVEGAIDKGILLGILLEGETKYITFRCTMSRLPEINPVINTADVYFIEVVGGKKKQIPSTAVVTVITDPNINTMAGSFEFFVDKEVIGHQDILSYKVRLTNQGNCKAENISIKNLVPIQAAMSPESIGGSSNSLLDREHNLIYIEELDIGKQITLTYDVIILPEIMQYEIPHQVIVEYEFVGPDRRRVQKKYYSQKVFSLICEAHFDEKVGGFTKTAHTSLCTVGDEILYTLKLTNSGNVTATHLRLRDRIPQGIALMPESLVVGGSMSGHQGSLEEGLWLPDLKSYETIEVSYKGKVKEEDRYEENLRSQAYITYDYIVGEGFVTGEDYSNVLETRVGIGLIDEEAFKLEVNQKVVTLKEEILYRMRLQNKGNISIAPIRIVMNKPRGTSLIGEGWEEREGNAYFEYLPDLRPNEIIDMMCPLVIENLEALGTIQVDCRLYYQYVIQDRVIEKNLYTIQEEPISVVQASVQKEDGGIIKSTDQTYVTLNDVLTYTTVLTNTGNITAQDVKIQRMLIGYTALEGEKLIEVGDIAPHESKRIAYQLKVQQLPVLGYIGSKDTVEYLYEVGDKMLRGFGESEEIITVVEEAYLLGIDGQMTQCADKGVVKPGDILTYTLVLTNRGNAVAEEIILTLPELQQGKWLGDKMIRLEKIEIGEVHYFTYSLEVDTDPRGETIVCNPKVDYVFYTSTGIKQSRSYEVVPIESPIHRAKLTTSVGRMMALIDKEYATLGDEITCKVQLLNKGNRTAKGVCIKPEKVLGIDFGDQVDASVLNLGDIKPGEGIEASYSVRIIEYQEELVLGSELRYTYNLEDNGNQEEVFLRENIQTPPIRIKLVRLSLSKRIDKLEVTAKERINYELNCKNEGNTEAVNVIIKECLPRSMYLCQETVRIEAEGTAHLVDQQTIGIAKIRPGEEIKVCFQVEVASDIQKEEISDSTKLDYDMQVDPKMPLRPIRMLPIETKFHVIKPKVEVRFVAEEEIGLIGEILSYKIEITNIGNIAIQDVLVGIELTAGIDSIGDSLENMRIPVLAKGEMRSIEFKVHITTQCMTGKGTFYPHITYNYEMEGHVRESVERVEGVELDIEEVKVEIKKKSDKDFTRAGIGEEINYRIQVINQGTMPINQLILYDELGANTHLIEGSLSINEVLISIAQMGYGINLGEMRIGQTLVLDYKVRVEDYYSKFIMSKTYLEYAVRRGESNHYIKGKTPIANHRIRMVTPPLSTLHYRNTLTLPYQYLNIDKILDFRIEAVVFYQSQVDSHHLSIKGQLKYRLVYTNIEKIKQSIEWTKLFIEQIEGVIDVGEEASILQAVIEKEYVGMVNNRQIESRVAVVISEG